MQWQRGGSRSGTEIEVVAGGESGEVGLRWDSINGSVRKYRIYSGTVGAVFDDLVTEVDASKPTCGEQASHFYDYLISGFECYVVTAVDDAGNESVPSEPDWDRSGWIRTLV